VDRTPVNPWGSVARLVEPFRGVRGVRGCTGQAGEMAYEVRVCEWRGSSGRVARRCPKVYRGCSHVGTRGGSFPSIDLERAG
jgi:hypothetical protein